MLFGSLHVCRTRCHGVESTEQVIHLLRAATDTFPSLTARSSHKYISSDDKRWQKMLHKFTTNYRETDLNFMKVLFAKGYEVTWDEKQLWTPPLLYIWLSFVWPFLEGPSYPDICDSCQTWQDNDPSGKVSGSASPLPECLRQIQICPPNHFWGRSHKCAR